MLVLTRKLNEEIVIGGNIRVKVIEITRGKIRVAIQAPDDVRVQRGEVPQTLPEFIQFELRAA